MMCCCNSKTLVLLLPILLLSFFSTVPHFANSSPLSNITIGSSLNITSSGDQRYWLSPSGNFAFGFYPVSCKYKTVVQCYVVGIWNAASNKKTLVWVANRDDLPLSDSSSIILTTEGILLVRPVPARSKGLVLLNNIQKLASYAMIHDNGNFVLYNSDSGVMWESFDYPTDTILPGQTLKPGSSLVASTSRSDHSSGSYILSVENNGIVQVYQDVIDSDYDYLIDKLYSAKYGVEHVEMILDSNGHLYLVDQNGSIVKNLIKGDNQTDNQLQNNSSLAMFRATLDSDGVLRLYKEEMGSGNKETSLPLTRKPRNWQDIFFWLLIAMIWLLIAMALIVMVIELSRLYKAKKQRTERQLELGTI